MVTTRFPIATSVLGWFRSKVVDPLILILKRGTEPKQLAQSASLGITLGLFPVCGVTVLLCGIAAAVLGANIHTPSLMLANFIATPVELSLIVPFLRIGEWITGGEHFELSSDAFKKMITGQASYEVVLGVYHAILGWMVSAPFILGILYFILLPVFRFGIQKFGGESRHLPSQRSAIRLGEISPKKEALA